MKHIAPRKINTVQCGANDAHGIEKLLLKLK